MVAVDSLKTTSSEHPRALTDEKKTSCGMRGDDGTLDPVKKEINTTTKDQNMRHYGAGIFMAIIGFIVMIAFGYIAYQSEPNMPMYKATSTKHLISANTTSDPYTYQNTLPGHAGSVPFNEPVITYVAEASKNQECSTFPVYRQQSELGGQCLRQHPRICATCGTFPTYKKKNQLKVARARENTTNQYGTRKYNSMTESTFTYNVETKDFDDEDEGKENIDFANEEWQSACARDENKNAQDAIYEDFESEEGSPYKHVNENIEWHAATNARGNHTQMQDDPIKLAGASRTTDEDRPVKTRTGPPSKKNDQDRTNVDGPMKWDTSMYDAQCGFALPVPEIVNRLYFSDKLDYCRYISTRERSWARRRAKRKETTPRKTKRRRRWNIPRIGFAGGSALIIILLLSFATDSFGAPPTIQPEMLYSGTPGTLPYYRFFERTMAAATQDKYATERLEFKVDEAGNIVTQTVETLQATMAAAASSAANIWPGGRGPSYRSPRSPLRSPSTASGIGAMAVVTTTIIIAITQLLKGEEFPAAVTKHPNFRRVEGRALSILEKQIKDGSPADDALNTIRQKITTGEEIEWKLVMDDLKELQTNGNTSLISANLNGEWQTLMTATFQTVGDMIKIFGEFRRKVQVMKPETGNAHVDEQRFISTLLGRIENTDRFKLLVLQERDNIQNNDASSYDDIVKKVMQRETGHQISRQFKVETRNVETFGTPATVDTTGDTRAIGAAAAVTFDQTTSSPHPGDNATTKAIHALTAEVKKLTLAMDARWDFNAEESREDDDEEEWHDGDDWEM